MIRELGGLHRFMGWDGAILTDSGGYQVFSLGVLREIKDDGVVFQSHLDGSRHFLTPERVMEIQENIGSDVRMCFDECVPYPSSYEYTSASVELTSRWAKRCRDARKMSDGLVFGIVQGGFYPDLRVKSALSLLEMDFDGYAIGGLSVGEPKDMMWEMIDGVIGLLPEGKPRYLMGLGFPEDILDGVGRGIDMFDCVIPTRHARNGGLFTWKGRINIKNAKYARDESPVDETCDCYTCRSFSRAYLRHLFLSHELSCYYLNTLHNLHFYADLVRRVREAIAGGVFREFSEALKLQLKGGETDDGTGIRNG
jgi:queuine tRNA-ribosyltransferase